MKKVLLVGEGANELGGWSGDSSYQEDGTPGVVESLLRKVQEEGWKIVRGLQWKSIRKYKANVREGREVRNVLGAVLEGKETQCDIVVFVRDRDGTNANANEQRQKDIEKGLALVSSEIREPPKVIGGVAVKKIESWLVAISGTNGSEGIRRPEEILETLGMASKDTAAMAEFVRQRGLDAIPEDASSLNLWLSRARQALGEGIGGEAS